MRLAILAGLNMAGVSLTRSLHKDVLLIERFDRAHAGTSYCQKWCSKIESGGGLIDFRYLYSIFEFDSDYHFRQIVESA